MEDITSKDYVSNVLRTESNDFEAIAKRLSDKDTIRLLHAAMGMATEAAEFVDMLKKHIFYGKPIDFVNAREEVGDQMWYIGVAVDVLTTTLDYIMTCNIEKLKIRYPEKFTAECSENRDTQKELRVYEAKTRYQRRSNRS